MGQFKPMVKMMTTEPTVELKLKKGGTVKGHKNMKSGGCMKSGGKADATGHSYMNGGISAALAGAPMIAAPRRRMAAKVAKPSMAARRAAMMATGRKNGGAMEALKKHEEKPASKAHKGLKTGGVAMGQGGYKTGGVVKGQGGYKDGGIIKSESGKCKVNTAHPDTDKGPTGDVKLGKPAGYKKGGLPKKFAEGGSVQDDGRPQKMAQGAKKPSSAVSIDKLSGTFKKGGKVASKKLQAVFKKENAPAMKAAKADSNLKYSKYQKMQKFADGGTVDATGRPVGFSGGLPMPDNTLTGGMPARPSSRPAYNPEGTITAMDYSNSLPGMSERPFVDPAKKFPMPTRGAPFAGVLPTRDNRNRLNFNPPPRPGNIGASGSGGMPLRGQNPQVAELIRQGNMQGAMALQDKLAMQNGKDIVPRPYKKGGKVKGYAGGGMSDYEQYMSPEEQLKEMRMRKAMDRGYGQVSEQETASNEALLDSISSLPKAVKDMVRKAMRGSGAVTDTEKTVSRTVVPAKKRGGKVRK